MSIRIFTTGGTMDGVGCDCVGCCRVGKDQPTSTNVPNLLAEAMLTTQVEVTELFVKNSSKVTSADIDLVLSSCIETKENQIVVTHGTHTMCKTARFLGENQGNFPGKIIVLTGAMKSTLNPGSDGPFNLGFAISAVQCRPAGVYVAMGGIIFSWDNVRKDETTKPARFTKIVE